MGCKYEAEEATNCLQRDLNAASRFQPRTDQIIGIMPLHRCRGQAAGASE